MEESILLIIPKEEKISELKKRTKLTNTKIIDMNYFLENYIYKYNEKAIYYLMKKYNYKYDITLIYLDSLIYVYDINESSNNNINKLIQLRDELLKEKLLLINPYFKKYVENKKIIIKNYHLSKFEFKIFSSLNYKIENSSCENKNYQIISFNTIEDEIEYIGSKICQKIKEGINIDNIILCNVSEEYNNPLRRIFKMLNIMDYHQEKKLYNYSIIKECIKVLKQEKSKNKCLKIISDVEIKDQVLQIFNKYSFCAVDEVFIEIFINECKQKIVSPGNNIKITSLNEYQNNENDYVYLVGFNSDNILSVEKDEQFLNDEAAKIVNTDTSVEKNIKEKEKIIKKINSITNLTITYNEMTPFQKYYKSPLVDELNMKINATDYKNYTNSNMLNKITLAKQLDNYNYYNKKDKMLDSLYTTYKDIKYQAYDNRFNGINKNQLYELLNDKLLLSYTSLNNFYHCQFRYYVENILKLNLFQESLALKIGNLFHYILSICFKDNFEFEVEWNKYNLNKNYTNKEFFFINKLKNDLLFLIETIREHNQYTSLNNELYEESIFIDKSRNIKITFMGKIDKIKYDEENGVKYAAIIDYKTGEIDINLKNNKYGFNMQLPIYVYLLKKDPKWFNIKITGFYLQKIISKNSIGKTDIEDKKNNFKLIGYSNSNLDILVKFDNNYINSNVIKSMKLTKKGLSVYAKTISDKQIEEMIELVDQKVNSAIDNIIEGNFNINPKNIEGDLLGCKYCKYQDLCYKRERDIVYIKGCESNEQLD